MSKITVLGLGYIGLPTAAVLADNGYSVTGVDINPDIIDLINSGKIHIEEPDLHELVEKVVNSGKLVASPSAKDSDIYIICVPTPFTQNGLLKEPDLKYIYSALESIISNIKPGVMIIIESTIPIGTCDNLIKFLENKGVDVADIYFAYCPERVLPGNILHEIYSNDRVVGGIDSHSANVVKKFYKTFVKGRVNATTAKTAEMCKLAENSFRDVNIAFANELSMLCDNFGIDAHELIRLANLHPRVNILQPGVGVGGHCISVDPWFIISADPLNSKLIAEGRRVNIAKTIWVVEKIKSAVKEIRKTNGNHIKIACFGLTFKPNVDDLRESPAIEIVENLLQSGLNVFAVEPHITMHDTIPITSIDTALETADICVLLVAHEAFKDIKNYRNEKILLDYCGLLDN